MIGRRNLLKMMGAAPAVAAAAPSMPPPEPIAATLSPGGHWDTAVNAVPGQSPKAVLRAAMRMGLVKREDLIEEQVRNRLPYSGSGPYQDPQINSWKAFSAAAKLRIAQERLAERELDTYLDEDYSPHISDRAYRLAERLAEKVLT